MTTKPSPLNWYFPLRRPHAGVTIGNGLQGVVIWGENTLLLTVPRASFWDHRGGHDILPTTNFKAVRHALDLATATVAVSVGRYPGDPEAKSVRIHQTDTDEVCWLDIDPNLLVEGGVRLHPAFSLVLNNAMGALGIAAPKEWADSTGGGFVQTLPSDTPLGVCGRRFESSVKLTV